MEENITHHHIRVRECATRNISATQELIGVLKGVKKVIIDREKRDVFVEYDLQWCSEEDIEKVMIDAGFVLDESYMQKLKRGWIHYTEGNEQENLHHKPLSCCDVDEIERKRKELK